MNELAPIAEDRTLSADEQSLLRWLLEHGTRDAANYLPQLEKTRVCTRCPCGCASIELAVDGVEPRRNQGMHTLADCEYRNELGHLFGVFVFERGGFLAGLELWSVDGESIPSTLPRIDWLSPISANSV
jgi:hypothetical protein